jgi:L-proline amide hydrolase
MENLIGDTSDIQVTTGQMEVGYGLYVTYWTYLDPSHPIQKAPVVALHGGPGFTHNYILPLKLLARNGHPVIFYD